MLVLTRKQEEKICIGDEIVITLLRVKGKSIRLGIEAPDKVCVLRGELVDASADKHASSNLGNATDMIRKHTGSRGRKNAGLVGITETPAPQTNVSHTQIPRERCKQVLASLQSNRGPLGPLMENRTSTV